MKFGEFLLRNGLISEMQLQEGLEVQTQIHEKLGRILVDLGFLSQSSLDAALDNFLGTEKVKSLPQLFKDYSINDSDLRDLGREHYLSTKGCQFLFFEKLSDEILKTVESSAGGAKKLRRLSVDQIEFIKKLLTPSIEVQNTVKGVSEIVAYQKILNEVLKYAKTNSASDIHLEPAPDGLLIRVRVLGDLIEYKKLDLAHRDLFLSDVRETCGLPLVVSGRSSDGSRFFKNINLKVRSNKLPTQFGDGICLRLIDPDKTKQISIKSVGFTETIQATFKSALEFNNGLILISGPTGSGKSTTVFALLMELNRSVQKVITLENPIELEGSGLLQVQVDEGRLSFAEGLRAILRHDPDVIMVGEIRDEDSAKTCFQAANTGHLVISTIHTNDSLGVIERLKALGISNESMRENLRLCVAQRLIKAKSGSKRLPVVELLEQEQISNYVTTGVVPKHKRLREAGQELAELGLITMEEVRKCI